MQTDGCTPEIALDITEQEVLLSKNGGAFTLKSETTQCVHDASHNGWYTILLDTTDTNNPRLTGHRHQHGRCATGMG